MTKFNSTNPSLFFSKNDKQDRRIGDLAERLEEWHDLSEFKELIQKNIAPDRLRQVYLGGYPDDEGIHLNGGRIGAREAPDAIRKFLYRMTPPLDEKRRNFQLYDIGNLSSQGSLEDRHGAGKRYVTSILDGGGEFIGLGGGHDYAYPDGAGFLDSVLAKSQKPLIINFDAHLDVRPLDRGLSSGTPFYRLLTEYKSQFDFIEIGIQDHCNSSYHLKWAEEHGAHIVPFEKINQSQKPLVEILKEELAGYTSESRPTYLSIDIDGFASAYAMGCSQSWSTGLIPNDFFPVMDWLNCHLDIKVFGVYEVSPPLDQDDRTSKLAAQLCYQYLITKK